jgi:uncharacterized protein
MMKFIFLLFLMLMAASCTHLTENSAIPNTAQTSPFSMSAQSYLSLAQSQVGEERQNLFIMAAGRHLYDGKWQEAYHILSQTSDLSLLQNNEKNILLAKIHLIKGQPQAAIRTLSSVKEIATMPAYFQMLYHDILANSYESVGKSPYAIGERIKLEKLLHDDPFSRTNNRKILWLTLTKLPLPELNILALETKPGTDARGWIKLALIARQASSQNALFDEIQQWQQTFPQHPASELLPSPLTKIKNSLLNKPTQMALLVPLTGPLSGPGNAIKEGFLAAHNNQKDNFVQVRWYDTGSNNVAQLYQQALYDGANYIVGPLSKNEVRSVAALPHPVPTLLLNDLNLPASSNAYYFGLSPVNEAKQVAVKANKAGLRKALIIAPSGLWGKDITNGFIEQWQKMGGVVTDTLMYEDQTDFNSAIRQFLQVSEIALRKPDKKMQIEMQNTPKRRQDFDMIFLLAYPSKARQIMPLLKYYYAGDMPVYATSSVYSGSTDTMRDRDLDGIIFCDMPWVFKNQIASKNWPEQLNSYNRLYAIGMDSYNLGNKLNRLLLFPAMGMNENSGILYLNNGKQISRILAWARFNGGIAQLTEVVE